MNARKFRWSKDYESAEEELVDLLAWRKIDANRWTASEDEVLKFEQTANNLRLWCAEGSFRAMINGKSISMQPGDGLDVPKGVSYELIAGIAGCICYQAEI
ncbi:MAG: Cupin [Patescibacteria group bacterium]|jgi:hypothetical protein|nr:Cupin [Patescibacteria group bacterium]